MPQACNKCRASFATGLLAVLSVSMAWIKVVATGSMTSLLRSALVFWRPEGANFLMRRLRQAALGWRASQNKTDHFGTFADLTSDEGPEVQDSDIALRHDDRSTSSPTNDPLTTLTNGGTTIEVAAIQNDTSLPDSNSEAQAPCYSKTASSDEHGRLDCRRLPFDPRANLQPH